MPELQSESVVEVTKALVAAMKKFKPAVKDSTNPHFKSKFVSLDGVYDAVREALLSNGIACIQPTRLEDGKTLLVTKLLHTSGEWLAGEYPINAVKQDPQAEGSALTYARRYALMAMVGIAPEDDDGQAASNAAQRAPIESRNTKGADPTYWEGEIDGAASPVALNRIGTEMATAPLSDDQRDRLRAIFVRKMGELREAMNSVSS